MHILYLHQHFATPKGSTGTRSYEFARRWVKAGHKITVITGYYDIGGLKTGNKLIEHHKIDGIDVSVVGISYSNKQSFIRRVWSFIVFMIFSNFVGLGVKGVDMVYATSTPLTVGIPAMMIRFLKRVPYVFEVRDQWPEIPIEMGIINNQLLIKLLLWLEKTIYKNAATIVALSPGMAEGITSVLGSQHQKPITVIPNSCDIDKFSPDIDGSGIRKERDWGNKFVLLHTGAMGKANGLDFVVSVAEKLKNYDDLFFVLAGEGREKESLIDRVAQLGLKNVEISDGVSKKDLPKLMAACDAAMIVFANYPILEHNSANKFFDALSAGKPILLNYSGWQRKIIEENNAGFGCGLCDLDEFVQKVLYLYKNHDGLSNMGKNARQLAINLFNRDDLARKALQVIETI
ncbi:MAG: glycosyltransferase family 4 protein, partial [Desulfobacterales bacterium]|nr:glycosyltransferase family 4 protein [Desulfobacterales bacterium]